MPIISKLLLLALFALPAFSQSFTYWRLNTLDSGAFDCLEELKFYDGGGTQIATTGGTPSASTSFSGTPAADAFDGDTSTQWCNAGPGATPASPVWLQYHFSTAVTVASFTMISGNNGEEPDSFQLQASNDGSTWTNKGYYNPPSAWPGTSGSSKTVTVNASRGSGIAYRISITAGVGAGDVYITELTLYDNGGHAIDTSLATGAGYIYASTVGQDNGSSQAIDGNVTSLYWNSTAAPSGGTPQTLTYRFTSSSQSVCSFTLNTSVGTTTRPQTFTFQSSPDNSTWTTIGTYSAATWTGTDIQTFAVTSCGGPRAWMILQ